MLQAMNIGISGAKGSFSEEAAGIYAKSLNLSDIKIEYLISVENVLEALENGSIERGIFPIENSNGGIVIEAVYAMAKHRFTIEKLFEIDVHQTLLAAPGINPDQITVITSHDQALKQCRMYLKRKWPGVDILPYPDTAKAAKDLSEGTLPKTTAVIASKSCAALYKLDVLEESIQDLKFNFTTFVAATK
jgi:prephenate dehydratase